MSTDSDNADNANDNDGSVPTTVDNTRNHTWIFETATSDMNTKCLTDAGVENIANHKYKSGQYTFLDNKLNPVWAGLTELLPMWLAPNMVTLLGAMHCGVSYACTWYYSPQFNTPCPDWVIFLSGYCTIAYYTFDCMDGKQARRTGQSSPLGQLFDHGFDCLCNLAHVSTTASYILVGGTWWFYALKGSLFLAFFMAQWEEYYTGQLPHAQGNLGVTEVNYSLGLFAILNSVIDREKLWTSHLGDKLPDALSNLLPSFIAGMELRHIGLSAWLLVSLFLIIQCLDRVLNYESVKAHRFSAVSKLVTPFLVAVTPFLLPSKILQSETRLLSISIGLLMSLLTKKMICFSMAKQSYAAMQMEAVPFFAVIILMRTDGSNTSLLSDRSNHALLGALSVWYAYRLVTWAIITIDQICKRLDINCLTIKAKPKTE